MKAPKNDMTDEFRLDSVSFSTRTFGRGEDARVTIRYTNGDSKTWNSLAALQSSGELEAVLDAVKDGKVLSVDYKVEAFVNSANKNHFRLMDSDVARAAKDTNGAPLLMDHRTRDSKSEVGVVGASEMITRGGHEGFKTEVSAREPSFQANFLRGMHRSYSSQFKPNGKVACHTCGAKGELEFGYYPKLECGHSPGRPITEGEHKGKTAELAVGVRGFLELSTTPNPALEGARAYGASLSVSAHDDHETERTNMANRQEESGAAEATVAASEYTRLAGDLGQAQAEKQRLTTELSEKQTELDAALAAADEWKEKAQSMAIVSLQAERKLSNKPEDIAQAKLLLSNNFEAGRAFLAGRPAEGQFDASLAGDDSANLEDGETARTGPVTRASKAEEAPERPKTIMPNGEVAVGLVAALKAQGRGTGFIKPRTE